MQTLRGLLFSQPARLMPQSVKKWLRGLGLTDWVETMFDRPYEEPLVDRLRELVQPGWQCVDLGANTGAIFVVLARQVGEQGHVTAFEPHPDNVVRLRHRLQRAGMLSRATIEQKAVADGSMPTVSLFPSDDHASAEWNIMGEDLRGNRTEAELVVECISMDAYLKDVEQLHLVKIDVEGAEHLVLAGMKETLERLRPILIIEFHNDEGWSGRRYLYERAYDLFDISGVKLAESAPRAYHAIAIPQEQFGILKQQAEG